MGLFQSWVDITFVLLNRHWIPGLEAMLANYPQLREPVEGTWRESLSSGICPCLRTAEFRPPIRLTWRLASTLGVCALSAWPLFLMLVFWVLGLYFECLFLGSLSLCVLRLSVLDVVSMVLVLGLNAHHQVSILPPLLLLLFLFVWFFLFFLLLLFLFVWFSLFFLLLSCVLCFCVYLGCI